MSRTTALARIAVCAAVAVLAGCGSTSTNLAGHASSPSPSPDLAAAPTGPINGDFETGDLTGWTVVNGTAFGPKSVSSASDYWGGAFQQHGDHHLWGIANAGDDATGELRSSSFTAGQPVSFLVSGGWDPDRLYVALVRDRDGAVLRKQTGTDDESYVRIVWDTSAFAGQSVHLQVVDHKVGSFGHINLDDVRTGPAAFGDGDLTFRRLGSDNQPAADAPAAARYAADPLRPQYHYTPYQGWTNDPNGLIQWHGQHQLFSQFAPYAPKFGPMHWSHVDSPDLVHLRELPVALTPAPPASDTDLSGRFTGSAVDDHGTLTVFYTDYTDPAAHPGATPEVVSVATSTDEVHFQRHQGNPVITGPPPGSSAGFRDPKVFRDPTDNRWKMVVGSGDNGHGKVQLYASDDLRGWSYLGVLTTGDGSTGGMWECPNLFPLGDSWVLMYSANNHVYYQVGKYDGHTFTPRTSGTVDDGPAFYAAQHYRDDTGRDLIVGWMDNWTAKEPTRADGWAGADTVTRQLYLRPDGTLGSRPVDEVGSLATGTPATVHDRDVTAPFQLGSGDSARLRAVLDLNASTAQTVTVRLHASAAEETTLRYDRSTHTLTLDNNRSGSGSTGTWSTHVDPAADGTLALDVLVDRSSVEVFTLGGTPLTARVYPRYQQSTGIGFAADGLLRIRSATLIPLGSSWSARP